MVSFLGASISTSILLTSAGTLIDFNSRGIPVVVPHYVKHMNNVKVVHTKETIKIYNNFTEAVTQKQSNGKMLQKYAAHPQKSTHAHVNTAKARRQ